MVKRTESILKEVLEKIEPQKEELNEIENELNIFLKKIKQEIKKSGIKAEIFVGGSFAKKTLIKKNHYDVDIFIRYDKKYSENEISAMTGKLLKKITTPEIIHGSRDYFKINPSKDFCFEIIPVIKVKKPEEANNVTDLSFYHVGYLSKKLNSKKILDEIKFAKAFCYANDCYGAESYVRGFSGYGIELLILYYKTFTKFVNAISKIKDTIVIDIEKQYRNKNEIMLDLNISKLQSPIILIDPTYKQRNALAALSKETFAKFQERCIKFLKNPEIKYFEHQEINIKKIKSDSEKKGEEFIQIKIKTPRQEGDIAGSKLLKFYNHLTEEMSKFFDVHKKGMKYDGKKDARCFFSVKRKEKILMNGPEIQNKKHAERFKKMHKNYFIKNNKMYAEKKIDVNISKFIETWTKNNKRKIKEMSISELKIVKE
jgi:tRNA nucleotidyltransferase (CCA-adding enzyme)